MPPNHSVRGGTLTIPNFRPQYSGEYICSARTAQRNYESSVFIIVTGKSFNMSQGDVMVMIVWQLDVQLTVPIMTKVVSSNPIQNEVYSIQHYVIKFVSDRWWFSLGIPVSSVNKTDCCHITEILLKVALNTMKPTNQLSTCFIALKGK